MLLLFSETEGFKIDTMGTYHGLSLESVKVRTYPGGGGEGIFLVGIFISTLDSVQRSPECPAED